MVEKRKLKMTIAGRFIDLLGHEMYGGPVQAVTEFIANAWDADAKRVEISVPENPKAVGAEIKVRDYGEGMNYDELNKFYLNVGYPRRKVRGERTNGQRLVMGRKGIGKLAGFGIAEDITLRSVKDGNLIQFNLNYSKLIEMPELAGCEITPDIDEKTTEANGVTVILKNLKLEKPINIDNFRKSIARRFALTSELMQINVNGVDITKDNLEFEYRIPEKDGEWGEENILGFGQVRYWFGFLRETIKDTELRGISIFARERVAQFTPFFFNLSGGIDGQVGLEYLTGQVKAEALDEAIDHIATPRQTVNWEFGTAPLLEKWGQEKIKVLCSEWKKRRQKKKLEDFKHSYSEFYPRIEALQAQEKRDLTEALEKISDLEKIDEKDFKVIANSMISGIERESVKKIIRRINATSEKALPDLYSAIKEWDIISAVAITEVVTGRIEIIKKFRTHIDNRLKEKGKGGELDMQNFIKEYPWLLGQEYAELKPADFSHEKGVDKWIEDEIIKADKELPKDDEREGRRFDLLCIKNDWQVLILELMRPEQPMDYDHVMRLNRYVTRIQQAITAMGTLTKFKSKTVFGLLIADRMFSDPSLGTTVQALRHVLEIVSWEGLFGNVEANYRYVLEVQRMKAPQDPRIKGLVNLD